MEDLETYWLEDQDVNQTVAQVEHNNLEHSAEAWGVTLDWGWMFAQILCNAFDMG